MLTVVRLVGFGGRCRRDPPPSRLSHQCNRHRRRYLKVCTLGGPWRSRMVCFGLFCLVGGGGKSWGIEVLVDPKICLE